MWSILELQTLPTCGGVLLVQAEFVVVCLCWYVPSLRDTRQLLVDDSKLPLEVVVVFYLEVPPPGQEGLFVGIHRKQPRDRSLRTRW